MIITSFQRIFTDASKNKSWTPKHFALVDEGLLSVSISTVFSQILAIEKVFQSQFAKSYKGKPILYCWRYWFHICNFYWTVALGRAQLSFNSIAQIVPASFTPVLLEELMFYLSTFRCCLKENGRCLRAFWFMFQISWIKIYKKAN